MPLIGAPCGWWIVFVNGRLCGGFLERDVARAVAYASDGDHWAVTFKQEPGDA